MKIRGFGSTNDGREAKLYTLENKNGMEITLCDYGAHLVSVLVPVKGDEKKDLVLGYDEVGGYETDECHFGASIGRNGNRIAGACFELNGTRYQLAANENGNNLHSGPDGYDYRYWEVKEATDTFVTFRLESPDKDQGFPGNFDICVTYTLTQDNAIEIHYEGCCDADTVANMTNHTYFNLGGHDSGDVLNQTLVLKAEQYSPVKDSKSIPTGEHATVFGTPMDFTKEKAIGQEINADFEQLNFTGGYDHNYILDKAIEGSVELMAVASCKETGIVMEAYTDLPAVQFYAGNFIKDVKGKGGSIYGKRNGFCLESQYIPNAINEESEEKPILRKGDTYDTTTVYKFLF
ncbi:MAG: aldose epimerase family protein [Fusicatenibacter sp.]|nr:galactose mutarotase [Lachnospiraceae bacterium]MDY2937456.1 aldose epimerase family protein [Fusicatenibacter sp.]